MFVEIDTNDVISEFSEGTLEYKEMAFQSSIEQIKDALLGLDPRNNEKI